MKDEIIWQLGKYKNWEVSVFVFVAFIIGLFIGYHIIH